MTAKEDFLGNKRNKKNLIQLLSLELHRNGIQTLIAEDDADVPIVETAFDQLKTRTNVIVVGSDTDLLVLLVALAPNNEQIYFCKQKSGKSTTKVYYNINQLIQKFNGKQKLLLFAYAITGCDTTSSLFGLGKNKAMETIHVSEESQIQASVFMEKGVSKEDLKRLMEKILFLASMD